MKKTFLLATLFIFVAGFAYAADPAVNPAVPAKQEIKGGPCKADKEQFCSGVKKGKGRIKKCLKANEEKLTPACKEKLAKMRSHHKR
ncbi:MAG: cysteine rich repeat-containing protein [bacterium]